MSPLGSHLAAEPGAHGTLGRLCLRALGTPDPSLRTSTRQVARAVVARRPQTVVDVGCGAGFLCFVLSSRLPDVRIVGVEQGHAQVARARRLVEATHASAVTFDEADAFAWVPPDRPDVVTCLDVLEYVDNDAEFLQRIATWLVPRGALVLHCRAVPTPRRTAAFRAVDPHFDGRTRAGYSVAELADMFTDAGLSVTSVRETMRWPAEGLFELTHPELGLLRSRVARTALLPLTIAATFADTIVPGTGAGLLVVAEKPDPIDRP